MSNFDDAFKYTVGNEGGYTNDKYDSGGPTNWGITQADLSRWLGRSASVQEVKDMSIDLAKAIYKKHYWDAMSLDQITQKGISMCMFDIGVVRGIGVPPIYAQQICNSFGLNLVVDGHIGPKTILAINSVKQADFVNAFSKKTRNGFLAIVARRPTQAVFIKGWLNRAKGLLTLANV